jgi:uncharacterized damage-inducible protein DinB
MKIAEAPAGRVTSVPAFDPGHDLRASWSLKETSMNKMAMHGEIGSMQEFFNRSTRVLEEADSGFLPQPGMFTAAQQVAHVAQTIEWFVEGAFASAGFNMDFESLDKLVRAVTSLRAARGWFEKAIGAATAAVESHSEAEWGEPLPPGPIMGGLPRFAILGALTDHTAHHRGALTVYSRLLNKVPPMPYMET